MRESCFDCCRKHIAQASVLLDETLLGYPHHFWFAMGHLAEAEAESLRENRQVAREIRKARMEFMNHSEQFIEGNFQGPSLDDVVLKVCDLIGDKMYLATHPVNSKKFSTDVVDEFLSNIRVSDPA